MAKTTSRKRWVTVLMVLALIAGVFAIPAQAASSSVDHIDIGVSLTADIKIDGVLYEDQHYTLQKSDLDANNLTITSSSGTFSYNLNNVTTSTGSSGISQFRIPGTFPVGTKSSPITYTVTLKKTVAVATASGDVTVPATFTATFGYWDSDNDCPGLDMHSTEWAGGSVVGGSGLDFLLGNADSDVNTKGTISIQKTLAGLELAADTTKAFIFDIYKSDGTLYTSITATVSSSSPYATTSVSEVPFGTYYIIERDAAVSGYTYTTAYHVESNAETDTRSEAFTLSASAPMSHIYVTNTYTQDDPLIGEAYVAVTKLWDDNGNPDRPTEVTVQLLLDGEPEGDPVTLNAGNDWHYKWYDLNGDLNWAVEEVNMPDGYSATVTNDGLCFTITNAMDYTPPTEPTVTDPTVTEPTGTVPSEDTENDPPPTDLDDGDDDLADVPYTGVSTGIWIAASILSGAGLFGMALTRRKEENN